jgi:endoglucanase
VFDVPHQLVYSPHEYGPRKAEMPWFKHLSYSSLLGAWQRMWAFIQSDAASPYAAPVWIGEFGTCNVAVSCVRSSVPGSQGAWFHLLLRFLRQHATVGWDFYTLNGTNSNNCATDNGLLTWGWNTLASPALQRALASAKDGPPAAPPVSGSLVPNSPPADTPRSPTSPLCTLPLAR